MDLGVNIDNKLKFADHINSIVTKANQRKSLILRCFLSRNPTTLVQAFKVYIRPLLEYASVIWSPSYVGQIIRLESVLRDFTKRIPGCGRLSYNERLSLLGLETLELRRLKFDLIMCFNIIKGNNCLDLEQFFTLNPNKNLRGHPFKIVAPLAKTNSRKFFFSHRVTPIRNSLPNEFVLAPNVNIFKKRLNTHNFDKFLVFSKPSRQ